MNVGLPLFDPDEKGILIWRSKRIEIALRTSTETNLETGGTVWHAAHRLSEYLIKNPSLVKNKRVLEIGCGCGLVGLVAAALGAKSVMMSDIDTQIPIIQQNIALNKHLRSIRNKASQDSFVSCQITCGSIWFGEMLADLDEDKYDVILGADIGYDVSLQDPISVSLYSGLVNKKSLAILAEEVRWKDVYSWYLESLDNNDLECDNVETIRSGVGTLLQTNSIKGSLLRDSNSTKGMGTNGTIYNQNSFDNPIPSVKTPNRRTGFMHAGSYDSIEHALALVDIDDTDETYSGDSTLTKYPCEGLTDNASQNVQLLESLISNIYATNSSGNLTGDPSLDLGSLVTFRVSMCPVKILKVNRKKLQSPLNRKKSDSIHSV